MLKRLLVITLLFVVSLGYSQRTPGEYNITILEGNSKESDFGAAFYGDDKIIFASTRNIFGKKWEGNNQSFSELYECEVHTDGGTSNLKKFDNNAKFQFHESSVSFAPDMKTVYFTRNNSASGKELFELDSIAVRKSKRRSRRKSSKDSFAEKNTTFLAIYRADVVNGKWENVISLPFNNKNYSVAHPAVNSDGTKLFFSSNMSGYGMSDIFVVDILKDGSYGEPKNLGNTINTSGRDNFPFVDSKNILYFSSDSRADGMGGLDIYAVKLYNNGTFSDVLHLNDPVNTADEDFSFIVNHDRNIGYFTSNKEDNAIGDDDIYYFNVIVPLSFDCGQIVNGIVKDSKTGNFIANSEVTVTLDNKKVKTLKTDAQGKFKVSLKCDTNYKIYATKDSYEGDDKPFKTTSKYNKNHNFVLELKPITCDQTVKGFVYNKKDNTPLSKVLVTFYDSNAKRVEKTKTDSRGAFSVVLKCNSSFKISAIKKEFEKEEQTFSTTDNKRESQKLALNLNKIVCAKIVSGTIYNKETNMPLADVNLNIIDENNNIIITDKTDVDGRYSITLDCKGKYMLEAGKPKFKAGVISFKIKKSDVEFDLFLNEKIDEVVELHGKIVVNVNPIYFELDAANITKQAALELDKVVVIMKKYPKLKIEAGSHTDARGPSAYNEKLSTKRANSTVRYITKNSIDASRITARGYGETQPTNRCVDGVRCSNEEYSQNRRTEFVILNPEILEY